MRYKELRLAQSLTQKQFADKLGVGQSTIAMWECGGRSPRANKLPKIAKILGCSIDELFGEKGAQK